MIAFSKKLERSKIAIATTFRQFQNCEEKTQRNCKKQVNLEAKDVFLYAIECQPIKSKEQKLPVL